MKRLPKWLEYGLVILVAAMLPWFAQRAWAAAQSISFGSGNGDPTFQFDSVTKAMTVQSNIVTGPTTQTIASGGTIAADACGGLKQVTAAGAVSTSTTIPFTQAAAGNSGCTMFVCNVGGTNTITLKRGAGLFATGGADLALAANTCVTVASDGTQWRQIAALITGT